MFLIENRNEIFIMSLVVGKYTFTFQNCIKNDIPQYTTF